MTIDKITKGEWQVWSDDRPRPKLYGTITKHNGRFKAEPNVYVACENPTRICEDLISKNAAAEYCERIFKEYGR